MPPPAPDLGSRRVGRAARRRTGLSHLRRAQCRTVVHRRRCGLTDQPQRHRGAEFWFSSPRLRVAGVPSRGCDRVLHRASHLVRVFVSARRLASRNAHRARGGPGLSRPSRCSIATASTARPASTPPPKPPASARSSARSSRSRPARQPRRSAVTPVTDRPIAESAAPRPSRRLRRTSTSTAWPLGVLVASQEGWRNLCRLVTRMKLRAPKGEGALTLDDFEGQTSGLIALPGRPLLAAERYGVGGLLDRLIGAVRPRAGLRRAAAASAPRSGRRQRHARVPGRRVSRADRRHRRRALCRARRAPALRRAHGDPRAHHARCGRASARGQRRALSQAAGADGAALCRSSRRPCSPPKRSPSGSSSR